MLTSSRANSNVNSELKISLSDMFLVPIVRSILMMEADRISETLIFSLPLTRLIA
jgi:hypothetical protein